MAGYSLQQWLRTSPAGVTDFIKHTTCATCPSSARSGTTLDAAIASAVLSVPVWMIDSMGTV
eukprot:6155585-Amphidinium_carterae.1